MRNACCYIFLLGFTICNSCFGQSNSSLFEDTSRHYFWICKMRMSIPITRALFKLESKPDQKLSNRKEVLSVTGELGYNYFNRNSSSDELLLINSSSHTGTAR